MSQDVLDPAAPSPCMPQIQQIELTPGEYALLAGAPATVPADAMRDILLGLGAQSSVPCQPAIVRPVAIPDDFAVAVLHYRSGSIVTYCARHLITHEGARALEWLAPAACEAQADALRSGRTVRYQVVRACHDDMQAAQLHPAALYVRGGQLTAVICRNLIDTPMARALEELATAQALLRPLPPSTAGPGRGGGQ